ncbi:MAG TPA: hypothetical protein VMD91_10020 [Candidatus Sulfotelmatobacter sp.]|nr:hypothetical protein [Candidatus Sulfotelmatobacter sp.]
MTRAGFLAGGALAFVAPRPSATRGVTAEVTLTREGTALLTPFTVTIVLHNPTGHVVQLVFPTADLFRVDVLRDDLPVWSSVNGHKPIPITRQIDVAPGTLRLAAMIVDSTTIDRRAFEPGRYVVRVSMLGTDFGTVVDKPIVFDPPATVAQALAAKAGSVITIAGVPYEDGSIPRLRDDTGSIRLSHPLALRPSGVYVVRGFLDAIGDERVFDVGRSAPAFDNPPLAPAQ